MKLSDELLAKLDEIHLVEGKIHALEQAYDTAEKMREAARQHSVNLRVDLEDTKKALAVLNAAFTKATIEERKSHERG